MTQLYKKIGFLIVFLMMCGGVRGQGNVWSYRPSNLVITGTNVSPTNGGVSYTLCKFVSIPNFITLSADMRMTKISAMGGGNSPSDAQVIVEYRWGSGWTNVINTFGGNTFNISCSPCGNGTTVNSSMIIDVSGYVGSPIEFRLTPIDSDGIITPLNRQSIFLAIYPPKPVISNVSVKESCSNTATGEISFTATSYSANAKVYVTKTALVGGYTTPVGCTSGGNADYPFCGNNALPINYTSPDFPFNVLNANTTINGTYSSNLLPGDYYITVLNQVSEPFLCPASVMVTIPSIPKLKDRPDASVLLGFPAKNVTRAIYDTNLDTRTVYVPNNIPDNELFISDFIPPSLCSDTDGSFKISGQGGNFPTVTTFTVKRTYVAKGSTPAGVTTTTTYPFIITTAPTHTVNTPRYIWSANITGLSHGEYEIDITDGCGQLVRNIFNMKEIIKIMPTNATTPFITVQPTCIATSGNSMGTAEIGISIDRSQLYTSNGIPVNFGIIAWNIIKDGVSGQIIHYEHIKTVSGIETILSSGNATSITDNSDFRSIIGTISTKIRLSNLPAGNYTLNLGMYSPFFGFDHSNCNGGSNLLMIPYTFTITAPTPVDITRTAGIENITKQNVSCPSNSITISAPNGSISVQGAGNNPSGSYSYYLMGGNNYTTLILSQLAIATPCTFSGLSAGSYKVLIKRGNDPSCNDSHLTQSIVITTPPVFAFTNVVKLNISCNGAASINGGDGSISAAINGGTRGVAPTNNFSYKYQLYKLTTSAPPTVNTYVTLGSVELITSASNTFTTRPLDIGFYKIKIIDASNCETYLTQNGSEIFEIQDPLLLVFDAVVFTNVVCIGDIATIAPSVSGGTTFASGAPYEFYYNLSGSTTRVPFTATTSLAPGSYTIWVKDSRGCELAYTGVGSPFVVRPPAPSALAVTTDVPLINGFAITCFGGDNGKIRLTTTGGVPFTTGGLYSYQLNNNMPIISSLTTYEFLGLFAGTYVVRIKDSYGCELVRTFVLNESTAIISLVSINVVPTICPNDLTGKITVQPLGGAGVGVGTGYQIAYRRKVVAPATALNYSLYVSVPSATNLYEITGLRAGTYEIIVKDGNDCSTLTTPLEVVVPSIKPVIEITSVIEQVRCFGESNGSISITPASGFVVDAYLWTGRTETGNTITNLIHASYEVEITYSGGCKEKFIFPITQPDVLNATSASTIACDKLNDGTITFNVIGGTRPYSYSINDGATWVLGVTTTASTESKIFANLAPGIYKPKVRDAKNCLKTLADITIRERGDDPHPRFLVATRQNAQDELVLINTSYPTPTSTVWTLDPRATVISQSTEEARVKFPVAGNYSVTMNATFDGCSYLITKNLVISAFDPNDPGTVVGLRPITSADIVPNPTTGSFVLNVVLTKKQYTKIVILDAMGNIRYEQNKNADRTLGFSESINLPTDLLSGLYILRVLTDNDAREIRFTLTR